MHYVNMFQPKEIFIEKEVVNSTVTQQILNKLPDVTVEYIDDYRSIRIDGNTTADVFRKSKERLAIAGKKGELVKQFRCRDGIIGNTEYFISQGNNCNLDCEYCFLQSYFDNAVPTVFVNHDEILTAIKDVLLAAGDKKTVFMLVNCVMPWPSMILQVYLSNSFLYFLNIPMQCWNLEQKQLP